MVTRAGAPRVVAITGVAGCLGRRLVASLDAEPSVERVIGVDVAEPSDGSTKLEHHRMDVRDGRLAKVLVDADAVVHLAFVSEPMRDETEMRRVNVDGTRAVVEATASTGARKLVFCSSAIVYGAYDDNAVPLTEASPARANPDFSPAWHTLDAEHVIDAFAESHPETVVTVLRPAIAFGPNVRTFMSRMLEAPRVTTVKGHEPPLQFVHEDDVASALAFSVMRDLPGAYNVAPDGWLSSDEVIALAGKRRVELPEAVAFSLAERLWRARVSEAPPGELHYVMHPWVIDNAKLKAAGWRPRFTNAEALAESLEAHKPWVALGRARMRKDDLAKGAAATIGVVGAMAFVRRARKKRDAKGA